MKLRWFITISILIFSFTLQNTLGDSIRIADIAPNFLIMIVVAFSILRGEKEGAIIGFLAGFIYDIPYNYIFGMYTIIYMSIGYICGKLHPFCYRENRILPLMCTVFSSLFFSSVNILRFVLIGNINFSYFYLRIVLPELVYTTLLTLVVYRCIYFINSKLEEHEKKSRHLF
ncbi:MAG: rod shape-determining protein MreD [Candidatus Epulonipiscioides saccharophilum]|nr:MAG: rod shape-determining protein MreD [Epulopiscium sp. AS2M-Bin001]